MITLILFFANLEAKRAAIGKKNKALFNNVNDI